MSSSNIKQIATKAEQLVDGFFQKMDGSDIDFLPPIIKSEGQWVTFFDKYKIAILMLDKDALQRISEYLKKGWHPFPGFLVSQEENGNEQPAAIRMGGECGYFSSNKFSHTNAFWVEPGASFTVVNQYMEISPDVKYSIDLGFVIGISPNEEWDSIEPRLTELLTHSLSIWRDTK